MSVRAKYALSAVLLLTAAVIVGVGLRKGITARRETASRGPRTHREISGVAGLQIDANELRATAVTPHLEYKITGRENVLWCATFQMAWNEACDLLGGPIQCRGATEMAGILNKRMVTREALDAASYMAMAGWTTGDSNDIRLRIRRELERKFEGAASPELLSRLDPLPPGWWAAYAYLFKELPFQWAFLRMRQGLRFAGRDVESFGIWQLLSDQENEVKAASQVLVYDHKSPDDFILELKTQSESDRLILAKVAPRRTLAETVSSVQDRVARSKPGAVEECSDVLIPVLDFDILRNYAELCPPIDMALQQIRFRLDERGAMLKSEGLMAASRVDTNLVFDKPFLVMLQRKDAAQPYFALWVANAELLVPSGQRE